MEHRNIIIIIVIIMDTITGMAMVMTKDKNTGTSIIMDEEMDKVEAMDEVEENGLIIKMENGTI